jgi:Histidine kinase-like ATPase domain
MNTMTLTRPAERHECRIRLTAGPAAAAEARRRIRAVVRAWQAPVDPDIAVLLTSDLVTDAIRHHADAAVTLAARCDDDQLRVEVHGPGPLLPWPADSRKAPGPGVILVATLSDTWGRYRTPEGEAAYFTLTFNIESS